MIRSLTALFLLTGLVGVSTAQNRTGVASNSNTPVPDKSAAYYNFAMGRLYQELAAAEGARNDNEYISKAIQHYQAALKEDPSSGVILEELTDLYIQTGRLRDAVNQAEQLLAENPDNLGARRMLGRIYTRMIGDTQRGRPNQEMLRRATEQYQKITEKDPKDADSWVMLGRLYRIANNSVEAEKAYNNALNVEPDNEDALTGLALLYAELGDYPRAIEKLKTASEKNASESTLVTLATAYEQIRDYKDAAEVLKKIVGSGSDNPRLHRALAEDLLFSGQQDEALKIYEQLAKDNARDGAIWLRMSQIYRTKRDFGKAQEALEKCKALEPDNIEVAVEEAKLLAAQGKAEQAIAKLKALIQDSARKNYNAEEAARRAALLEQLALLYRDSNQYQQSIDTFRQIASLVNGDGAARIAVQIVETYRQEKDYETAQRESDAALKKYPNDRMVVLEHASVLADRGKTDEAANEVRSLLKGEQDRDTLIALAQVYEKGKRYNDEAKILDQVDKLSVTDEEKEYAGFLRGAMYERQKKYEAAEAEFRKVLAINPRDANALNYLGYMLANRGVKLEEALQLIQKALEIEPDSGAYLDSLGWAYYQLGRLHEAEGPLLRAIEKIGDDPTVHDHLGDVYLKMGKTKDAIAQWQTSLKRYQASPPPDQDPEDMAKITRKLEEAKVRLAKETASKR